MNADRASLLLPAATSLLFAGSFVAGKFTTLDLQPVTTTLLRYAFALAFLGVLGFCRFRTQFRLKAAESGWLALAGMTGIVGYHYFFFSALHFAEVANTAIINGLSPVFTAIAAAVVINEKFSARTYAGLALSVIGAMALLVQGEPSNLWTLSLQRGDLLMLVAVFCWVAYSLIVRRLSALYSGFTITFYATAFGVGFLMLLAPLENGGAHIAQMSVRSFWSIVYMGVAASGAGYLLYNLSVARLGPTRTSSYVYSLVPIFAALLAMAFLGQAITARIVLSAALVLAGLNLMLREDR